jgi:ABC-type sugar transport system permease subunit
VQTFIYIIPSVLGAVVIGMIIALVLNQKFRGRSLVRASLLIPWAIPPVVVASMFQWFLDSRRGLLPYWLERMGIVSELGRLGFGVTPDGRLLFFSDGWLPSWMEPLTGLMATFVGIHLWKTVSLVAIILLVALQYLPEDTLHAARLDRAKWFHRFRYIILPHLWPAMVAAMIVQFLLTITLFDVIFALGSGGVKESTLNLYVYAYRTSFFLNDLGYGAVLAYVVSGITVVFALVLTRGRIRAPL